MSMQIRIPRTKLTAPKGTIILPGNTEPALDRTEEPTNVFVKLPNLIPAPHPTKASRRNVQLRQNSPPMLPTPTLNPLLPPNPHPHTPPHHPPPPHRPPPPTPPTPPPTPPPP